MALSQSSGGQDAAGALRVLQSEVAGQWLLRGDDWSYRADVEAALHVLSAEVKAQWHIAMAEQLRCLAVGAPVQASAATAHTSEGEHSYYSRLSNDELLCDLEAVQHQLYPPDECITGFEQLPMHALLTRIAQLQRHPSQQRRALEPVREESSMILIGSSGVQKDSSTAFKGGSVEHGVNPPPIVRRGAEEAKPGRIEGVLWVHEPDTDSLGQSRAKTAQMPSVAQLPLSQLPPPAAVPPSLYTWPRAGRGSGQIVQVELKQQSTLQAMLTTVKGQVDAVMRASSILTGLCDNLANTLELPKSSRTHGQCRAHLGPTARRPLRTGASEGRSKYAYSYTLARRRLPLQHR